MQGISVESDGGGGASSRGVWVKLASFVAVTAALLTIGLIPEVRHWFRPEMIERGLSSLGNWGPVAVLVIGIVSPLLFLPRWPIAVVSGLLYGVVWGTILANIASLGGAWLHYGFSRYFLGGIAARWRKEGGRLQTALGSPSHAFVALFALRAFPLSNFVVTNMLSGSLRVPVRIYLTASFFGMIPSSLLYASCGKAVKSPSAGFYALALSTLMFIVAGTIVVRRKNRKNAAPPSEGSAADAA